MGKFYSAFFEHTFLFILILVITGGFYLFIFRRYYFSLFDPLLFWLISIIMGTTDVVFMFATNSISKYYFLHYLVSQLFFLFGFFMIKPINKKSITHTKVKNDILIRNTLFMFSGILQVLIQLYVYYKIGIPLFMESRLGAFAGGGGLGIFSRIIYITNIINTYVLVEKYFDKSQRYGVFDYFIALFILVTLFFSGSKSAFLGIVFIIFYYQMFQWKKGSQLEKVKNIQFRLMFVAIPVAVLVIVIQQVGQYGSTQTNPLISLLLRFVNSGNVYMYAYVNNFLEQMPDANTFKIIFKDIIGLLRLESWSNLPRPLGLELWQNYHNNFEVIRGPNPRHNVFGLHYMGPYISIIYSFFIGLIISLVRNDLYRLLPASSLAAIFYIMFSSLISINVDVTLQLGYINNVIFVFFPLLIFVIVLLGFVKPNKVFNQIINKYSDYGN